ncbi:MAG: pSer/pThr/pTyr-binding forkhead associated (FHA) protein [Rhodothermales bacterium]|jgi:pSer/pThr/pTyr-binding forkhead associated (FHA) protein
MPTPKIIVLSEQLRGQSYELSEDVYTIGRVEEADICIPDQSVSTRHGELRRDAEGSYVLYDLGSSNGSRVNGARITEQKLVHSDILQIGNIEVMFDCEEQSLSSVLSTQTGIDLASTAGGIKLSEMTNFSPYGSDSKRKAGGTNKAFVALVALLLIVVLVLAVIAFKQFF